MNRKPVVFAVMLTLMAGLVAGRVDLLGAAKPQRSAAGRFSLRADEKYPFASWRFDQFVKDSFDNKKSGEAGDFYNWLDNAYKRCKCRYKGKERLSLTRLLDAKKREFDALRGAEKKTKAQIEFAAWMHKMVKAAIPHFSLDRGFEFYYTVKNGERQCFLQSVLIAGMLQRAGLNAGVLMVYRNPKGEESNNGHAVTLLKLAGGRDILVDASEPEPFPTHQGLFVKTVGYRYVIPIYAHESSKIIRYEPAGGGAAIEPAVVHTLDYAFLQSQFYYYRGERTVGGLLADKKTREGLQAAEQYLRKSVQLCPENPLAVFQLGRVYLAEGNKELARNYVENACGLYARFGWTPSGPKEYQLIVKK